MLADSLCGNIWRRLTHYGGGMGFLGVSKAQSSSAGAPFGSAISPDVAFPIASFFRKELSFRGGAVDPKQYASVLIDLITSGKARPSFVISAAIGIEDAGYYGRFYRQEEVKVVIQFPR
ncbi:hypothetical protein LX32DRAFT_716407 [Colletotrichum zoysiae]|uniref:Uncharacterized protein n=1 Tax=Colletotrichum zoysiae TaxID=1216348 RepID=A0AAD9H3D7_9PEZI|nr:hypothetical protein LX32DRAFT_716407 [Colletotrichum zoysiae]